MDGREARSVSRNDPTSAARPWAGCPTVLWVGDVITFGVAFVLGIVGTLLIEWRFRPQFEQKRRAQEWWEHELQELLELLEIRLPRLTHELNHFLGMAKHDADFEEVEDLNPQQREALRFAERDRESAQRAYEAWAEVAQTIAVLSRRVARFHRPDALTTHEASARFYSMLYATEVFDFRMGKMPSGNYEQEEKKRRKQLQGWVESLQREGRPHRTPRQPSVRPEDLVTHVTKCAPRA
jgi:hypothetical protein